MQVMFRMYVVVLPLVFLAATVGRHRGWRADKHPETGPGCSHLANLRGLFFQLKSWYNGNSQWILSTARRMQGGAPLRHDGRSAGREFAKGILNPMRRAILQACFRTAPSRPMDLRSRAAVECRLPGDRIFMDSEKR